LDETIWSLTSPHVKRISGSKNFRSTPQKDFCNNLPSTEVLLLIRLPCRHATPARHGETIIDQTSPTILDFEENQGLKPMRFAHSLYIFIRRIERPFPCVGVPGSAAIVSVTHFSRALYVASFNCDARPLFDAA
jgi:hypothetical protein